jgi:hypothetical protein
VLGVVLIVVALLLFPIVVLISGGIASGILGWFLQQDADAKGDDLWKQLNY